MFRKRLTCAVITAIALLAGAAPGGALASSPDAERARQDFPAMDAPPAAPSVLPGLQEGDPPEPAEKEKREWGLPLGLGLGSLVLLGIVGAALALYGSRER